MAKITAQVAGGNIKSIEGVATVGDLKETLGVGSYQATVNGEPQDNNYELSDYEFVALTAKVKGGC